MIKVGKEKIDWKEEHRFLERNALDNITEAIAALEAGNTHQLAANLGYWRSCIHNNAFRLEELEEKK